MDRQPEPLAVCEWSWAGHFLGLVAEVSDMLPGAGNGDDERALLQLVAAHRVAPGVEVDSGMREALAYRWNLQRLVSLTHRLSCIAFSPDGSRIVSGSRDRTSRLLPSHKASQMNFAEKTHAKSVVSG